MDLDWLREHLATDFVHVSPFGRLEGREHYLATVEPMARKSVRSLEIRDVVSTGDRAAIWFRNGTPEGAVESCDWLRVANDTIVEITSFYDSAAVRKVLSPSEQADLGGSQERSLGLVASFVVASWKHGTRRPGAGSSPRDGPARRRRRSRMARRPERRDTRSNASACALRAGDDSRRLRPRGRRCGGRRC